MLRPICSFGRRVSLENPAPDFVRTKIVRPASILKPADKLKLYHKENKELFGPLLETNKQKKKSLHKAKNSKEKQLSNIENFKDNTAKVEKLVRNAISIQKTNIQLTLELMNRTMWQNTRSCVNFVSALSSNVTPVRGFKTHTVCNATKTSAAKPGYVSEDKIIQMKAYKTDYAQQYPSVTLILNKTMTEDSRVALEKWKREQIAEMGEDNFKKFYEAQMATGTKFHSTLKSYFTQPKSQLRIEKDVEGVWVSVADVLKNVSSPKAIESNVVHPLLKYRGVFDAIADYEDKPTLIEWKKSDKARKSLSVTYDNPIQLAAYYGAVCNDLNYKHLNVRDALLVIAYTDGSKADAYHLPVEKLREHWAQWLSRLEVYTKNYGNNEEKFLKGGKRLFEEDIGNLQ